MDIVAASVHLRRKRLASSVRALGQCARTGPKYGRDLLGAEQPEVDVAAVAVVEVFVAVGFLKAPEGDEKHFDKRTLSGLSRVQHGTSGLISCSERMSAMMRRSWRETHHWARQSPPIAAVLYNVE